MGLITGIVTTFIGGCAIAVAGLAAGCSRGGPTSVKKSVKSVMFNNIQLEKQIGRNCWAHSILSAFWVKKFGDLENNLGCDQDKIRIKIDTSLVNDAKNYLVDKGVIKRNNWGNAQGVEIMERWARDHGCVIKVYQVQNDAEGEHEEDISEIFKGDFEYELYDSPTFGVGKERIKQILKEAIINENKTACLLVQGLPDGKEGWAKLNGRLGIGHWTSILGAKKGGDGTVYVYDSAGKTLLAEENLEEKIEILNESNLLQQVVVVESVKENNEGGIK